MLEASPISLVDIYAPVDKFSLFSSLLYPNSLQQTLTSTRPVAPGSYVQDLGEFLAIWKERIAWLKSQKSRCIYEYFTVPAYGDQPSQFCMIVSFEHGQEAANYRKHFYP